jgi:hypothetical protein
MWIPSGSGSETLAVGTYMKNFLLLYQVCCEIDELHKKLRQVFLKKMSLLRTAFQQQPTLEDPVTLAPGHYTAGASNATLRPTCPPLSGAAVSGARQNSCSGVEIEWPVYAAAPGATLTMAGVPAADGKEKFTMLVHIPCAAAWQPAAQVWVTVLPLHRLLAYCTNNGQSKTHLYDGGLGVVGRQLRPLPWRVVVEEGGLAWLTLCMYSRGQATLFLPGGTLVAICRPVLNTLPLPLRPVVAAAAEAEVEAEAEGEAEPEVEAEAGLSLLPEEKEKEDPQV